MMQVETTADRRMTQAHLFNATARPDFIRLNSRFYSSCIGCNGQIAPGQSIMWSNGCGSCCLPCFRDLKGACK